MADRHSARDEGRGGSREGWEDKGPRQERARKGGERGSGGEMGGERRDVEREYNRGERKDDTRGERRENRRDYKTDIRRADRREDRGEDRRGNKGGDRRDDRRVDSSVDRREDRRDRREIRREDRREDRRDIRKEERGEDRREDRREIRREERGEAGKEERREGRREERSESTGGRNGGPEAAEHDDKRRSGSDHSFLPRRERGSEGQRTGDRNSGNRSEGRTGGEGGEARGNSLGERRDRGQSQGNEERAISGHVETGVGQKATGSQATATKAAAADTGYQQADPTLDFTSEHFDPLKALQTPNLPLPFPKIAPMDNLAAVGAALFGSKKTAKQQQKPAEDQGKAAAPPQPVSNPAQGPLKKGRGKKVKNVLERMEASTSGPLCILHTCFTTRCRTRVVTRRARGVRGTCTGFLKAFDKHMNMVLVDCEEVFTIPVSRLGPSRDPTAAGGNIGRPHNPGTKAPEGFVWRIRHVEQLFVRGDSVVMVGPSK